jgi:ribosomal protein S18 acetylase RimI-like enzyme
MKEMDQAVRIREARKDEIPLIKRLSVEELPDELNEIERREAGVAKMVFAARLEELSRREGNELFVAEVAGSTGIAGYVWFGVSERPFSDLKVGWIYDLLVLPEHRGKGVGEALLRRALEASRKRGFELSGLMVRANNKVAYSLYEKVGFRPEYILMSRPE